MQQECNRYEQVTISEKLREFRLRKSKKNIDLITDERKFIQRKKSEKKSETFQRRMKILEVEDEKWVKEAEARYQKKMLTHSVSMPSIRSKSARSRSPIVLKDDDKSIDLKLNQIQSKLSHS